MSLESLPTAKFRLGHVVVTANARFRLLEEDILSGIRRHQAGDWGDVSDESRLENEFALQKGGRLWSVYHDRNGVKYWIITEADRSVTTILLLEDY